MIGGHHQLTSPLQPNSDHLRWRGSLHHMGHGLHTMSKILVDAPDGKTLSRFHSALQVWKIVLDDLPDWGNLPAAILLVKQKGVSIQAGHQAPLECCLPL